MSSSNSSDSASVEEGEKKYEIPFMGPYAEMFEKSQIISQLVPRKV